VVARNIITILDTFEESGWPPGIDDPIPGGHGVVSSARLHQAIHSLNRGLKRLRFRSNGSGDGIIWEVVDP
jgi:hypothetical protein